MKNVNNITAEEMAEITNGWNGDQNTGKDGDGYMYFLHYIKDWENTNADGEHIIYRCKNIKDAIAAALWDIGEMSYYNRTHILIHDKDLQGYSTEIQLLNGMKTVIEQSHDSEKDKERINSEIIQLIPIVAFYYIDGGEKLGPHAKKGNFRAVQLDNEDITNETFGGKYTSCYMCGAVDMENGHIHGEYQDMDHWR